jgi:hypothetical protein
MSFEWIFKEATPGDRARESQVEKFFSSDAVRNPANAVVREGIQNSLDAASSDTPVHVRITLGEWSAEEAAGRLPMYTRGLHGHLIAEGVAQRIRGLPSSGEAFRYLVFEDFGTSGLKGDTREWWPDEHGEAGAFFKYFRAEGISGKGDGARGRHGVGRLVFMFASRARAMFGLTIRACSEGTEELLMGTAVLRNHRLDGIPFLPDGWFGVPDDVQKNLTLPISEADAIARFKRDFGVTRDRETGLSVVVPWLADDVGFDETLDAVLSEYFYPVLAGRLTVEIQSGHVHVWVDGTTIQSVVASRAEVVSTRLGPVLALASAALQTIDWLPLRVPKNGAPRWNEDVVDEASIQLVQDRLEGGQRIFLEAPVIVRSKGRPEVQSSFRICFERDPAIADSTIYFIREGIIVSDVRPRRTTGVRALVIIERGALGEFLGDAENPSHTQWQKDLVKERYKFAPGQLEYVVQSIPSLLAEISQKQKRPEVALLLDLFAVPAKEGVKRPLPQKKPRSGPDTDRPNPDIEAKPRKYSISRKATGFVLSRGDAAAPRPTMLTLRVAYDVRRGNPFGKYNPADFELGQGGVKLRCHQCEIISLRPNAAVLRTTGDDFEFAAEGFDVSARDLCIDVRVHAEAGAPEMAEEMG